MVCVPARALLCHWESCRLTWVPFGWGRPHQHSCRLTQGPPSEGRIYLCFSQPMEFLQWEELSSKLLLATEFLWIRGGFAEAPDGPPRRFRWGHQSCRRPADVLRVRGWVTKAPAHLLKSFWWRWEVHLDTLKHILNSHNSHLFILVKFLSLSVHFILIRNFLKDIKDLGLSFFDSGINPTISFLLDTFQTLEIRRSSFLPGRGKVYMRYMRVY